METANQQRNLFPEIEAPRRPRPEPLAARADPETSHAAARALVASGRLASSKASIVAFLKTQSRALTSREIAHFSGLDRHDCARRLSGLVRQGLVIRCEARVCEIGKTLALTWRAASAATTAGRRSAVTLSCKCGEDFQAPAETVRYQNGMHCPNCRRFVELSRGGISG
jgi:DNA-binding Lrp family transcriptional regulator